MMLKLCTILTTLAITFLVTCAETSLSNEQSSEGGNFMEKLGRQMKLPESWLSLLDWGTYMQMFNKRYSSLVQQLARQRIFIAGTMKVFIVGLKYEWNLLDYFTVVNRYTDLMNSEVRLILSGDLSDVHEVENDDYRLMDDHEAEEALVEELNEATSVHHDRRKRGASTDSMAINRDLTLADLFRTETSPTEAKSNVKFIIESNNPNYKQINFSNEPKYWPTPLDIPPEKLKNIENEIKLKPDESPLNWFEKFKLKNPISVVKSTFGDAMQLIMKGPPEIAETDDIVVLQDWRKSGCISEPLNQGYCVSCYAVSSIAYAEWALCRSQGNILTPLSAQYMVSCGKQYGVETEGRVHLDGCNRGMSHQTLDFIKEYGLELEVHMPYLERETKCPVEPYSPRKIKGYVRPNVKKQIRLYPNTSKLDLALKTGPVIVTMREPKDFLGYGGGLIDQCETYGGHAMLIVGSMIENGVEILLIKNSFGPNWGYRGFFKFRRSAIKDCVLQFIKPVMTFPSERSQIRRAKAYLARKQDEQEAVQDFENQVEVESAGGLRW